MHPSAIDTDVGDQHGARGVTAQEERIRIPAILSNRFVKPTECRLDVFFLGRIVKPIRTSLYPATAVDEAKLRVRVANVSIVRSMALFEATAVEKHEHWRSVHHLWGKVDIETLLDVITRKEHFR